MSCSCQGINLLPVLFVAHIGDTFIHTMNTPAAIRGLTGKKFLKKGSGQNFFQKVLLRQ